MRYLQVLTYTTGVKRYLQVLRGTCRCYKVPTGLTKCLQVVRGIYRCYEVSAGVKRYLKVLGGTTVVNIHLQVLRGTYRY